MIIPQLTYSYPYEIVDKVSYYLTNKQKGVCRNVCSSWKSLFTPSQYRHVQLRGRRQFHQFFQSLLSSVVGHYVRRLSVNDVYMTAQELESLPSLCPNLVFLSFNGKAIDSIQDISLELPFSQWKHLRRLTELQDLTVTSHLLRAPNSPISSLTHLCIRFSSQAMKDDLFASLNKASDLECLSLDSVTLSLSELEMIHNACPNIQKIQLVNADLEPIGRTTEEKRISANYRVNPAKCMKIFEFQNSGNLYDNYEWLYYFASKYINLVSLELWCKYSVSIPSPKVPPTTSELEKRYGALASVGMNCRNLKSISLINISMNHWLFEVMDNVGIKLDSISLGDMTDNTIDMLQCLIKSKQNVTSLTLWGWPSLCIQETMEETVAMVGMCSDRLSSINFSMQFSGIKNAPIPIDMLLNHCSKLRYLKFDNIQAVLMAPMNAKRDNPRVVSSVKSQFQHLVFENGSFRNEIFEYLSVCCPNLTNLEINSCSLIGEYYSEMDIKIHMPHHTFQSISISHARPPSHYYHVKQASDIHLFDVSQLEKNRTQIYELTDYEQYTPSLTFDYEQKAVEYNRPTNYRCHQKSADSSNQLSGPFVSIKCQALIEFSIGALWVI